MSNRREFLKKSAQTVAAALLADQAFAAPFIRNSKLSNSVIVLGIDGLDPNLLLQFIQKGGMPTCQKLITAGHWSQLRTTTPPQSPVAWSSFISGTNPGGHGIFDFIHRDPATFTPFLSTSKSHVSNKVMQLGGWRIPLQGGRYELLRRGPEFWTFLEDHGIPVKLFKLPATFPVSRSSVKMISGMGTPDLLGSYGTFTLFSDEPVPQSESFTGGRVVPLNITDNVTQTVLEGPPNELRRDAPSTFVSMTISRDPWEAVVKIDLAGRRLMLREGEWSDWVPVRFEMLPRISSVAGMVRIFVQQVHPHLRLYFSPINVDPMEPDLPISNPNGWATDLVKSVGRFYTQGFPEDTKALSHGVFSDEEFIRQSKLVLQEQLRAFEHELSHFTEGFLFFYFSSIDQNTHMLLRAMDPSHSQYNPKASAEVKDALYYFYRAMDDVLKMTLSRMPKNTTLLVMSDHGFAPFTREFHAGTWLFEKGYTALSDAEAGEKSVYYDAVNWRKTKAYAMGLNGIYLNVAGREKYGSVNPRDVQRLKDEIITGLCQEVDPLTKIKPVAAAYDSAKIYNGPYRALAPDIIVGYERGYRISDEAALGNFPKGVFRDRQDKWSADHCMAPHLVPGVLLSNQEIHSSDPALWDLAPSILDQFGIAVPKEMEGRTIFSK